MTDAEANREGSVESRGAERRSLAMASNGGEFPTKWSGGEVTGSTSSRTRHVSLQFSFAGAILESSNISQSRLQKQSWAALGDQRMVECGCWCLFLYLLHWENEPTKP